VGPSARLSGMKFMQRARMREGGALAPVEARQRGGPQREARRDETGSSVGAGNTADEAASRAADIFGQLGPMLGFETPRKVATVVEENAEWSGISPPARLSFGYTSRARSVGSKSGVAETTRPAAVAAAATEHTEAPFKQPASASAKRHSSPPRNSAPSSGDKTSRFFKSVVKKTIDKRAARSTKHQPPANKSSRR